MRSALEQDGNFFNRVLRKKYDMTVEQMFQAYLKLAKLDPSKISDVQYIETQRAFFAGAAQTLSILIESSQEQEDIAVMVIDKLHSEVQNFWNNQKQKK